MTKKRIDVEQSLIDPDARYSKSQLNKEVVAYDVAVGAGEPITPESAKFLIDNNLGIVLGAQAAKELGLAQVERDSTPITPTS